MLKVKTGNWFQIEIRDHNIEIMPGVLTSMRQFESNIMLVADLSFKVSLKH